MSGAGADMEDWRDEDRRDRRAADRAFGQLEGRVEALKARADLCVTRAEFEPVKLIAFGLAGTVLLVVLGAILAMAVVRG